MTRLPDGIPVDPIRSSTDLVSLLRFPQIPRRPIFASNPGRQAAPFNEEPTMASVIRKLAPVAASAALTATVPYVEPPH